MTPDPPIHPIADAFPMLSDEELAQLAEDIATNGLLHPIVLDTEGRVLDGRNRLAACKLAGVEPTFVEADPPDPLVFVISENVNRRHMGAGARAMAVLKAARDQETKSGHQTLRLEELRTMVGVGHETIAQASVVYQYAPDLVEPVIRGGSLHDAYEIATQRKQQQQDDQKTLRRLKRHHPDLFARIEAGTLDLHTAVEVAEMLAEQDKIERRIAALTADEATLAREQIEPYLTAGPDDAWALARRLTERPTDPPPGRSRPTGIVGAIDTAGIARSERVLDSLRLRTGLLRSFAGRDPAELSRDLPIAELGELQHALEIAIRWLASAHASAEAIVRRGRLEALP